MNPTPSITQEQIAARAKVIRGQIAGRELFAGEKFRVAARPFSLPPEQIARLEKLGPVIQDFYRACNLIYRRSWKEGRDAWVADYLDRGKPEALVQMARQKKFNGDLPVVLRPDLLVTDDGFALTELDSVPGGIGLTGFLAQTYAGVGFQIVGGANGMAGGFRNALGSAAVNDPAGIVAICVSEESAMYRPEMEWVAGELRRGGLNVEVIAPEELEFHAEQVSVRGRPINLLYRFFELFDLPHFTHGSKLLDAVERQTIRVTPPFKPVFEEKMWFALFRHPALQEQWVRELGRKGMEMMESLIPVTAVMDPAPLPPQALIAGVGIHQWNELKGFSQKEREWIIKISGFSPEAWGAKGVYYGRDMPQEEWAKTIDTALEQFARNPHIIQRFSATAVSPVDWIDGEEVIHTMKGRVRLCPYYFCAGDGRPVLSGALATICPADKKLIHGMDVAVLSPLAVESSGD
ncbi:hypothetical protein QPK87_38195 [Kamptonema cortianum]|nr:hypothetical protein [Kamptonema cortianum]MDL5049747.1 hypothetical protein [Oscillatoria amoena NRMC-F 0135]